MNKKELIKFIDQLPDNYEIGMANDKTDIVITLTKKVDEFEDYCDKLDNDVFVTACSIFNLISDITINEFATLLNEEDADDYKKLFKTIVEFTKKYSK